MSRPRNRDISGRGLISHLKKAHDYIKGHKIISSALKHYGHNRLSSIASIAGYGKRMRRRTKRRKPRASVKLVLVKSRRKRRVTGRRRKRRTTRRTTRRGRGGINLPFGLGGISW